MNIDARLALSYYETISVINQPHNVYLVKHRQTGKIYVKKILNVYNRSIYEVLKNNPVLYTPRIYEIAEDNHELTIIEEYISGSSLEELLACGRRFTQSELRFILLSLCQIVSNLHHCIPEIIHRDIKPSNILLTPSGNLYLLDFNAAKFHHPEQNEDTVFLGTRGYAAPEQYGFGASNIQTDIYAIGMLMNTLIQGKFTQEICITHELSPILMKCTRLDAAERYQSIDEIISILTPESKASNDTSLKANQHPHWLRFLPPGFRTLKPLHMIPATILYAFLFLLTYNLSSQDDSIATLIISRIFFLLTSICLILCSCNYADIWNYFPPCRTQNKFLKFLAVLLLDSIVLALCLLFLGIVASIFFS